MKVVCICIAFQTLLFLGAVTSVQAGPASIADDELLDRYFVRYCDQRVEGANSLANADLSNLYEFQFQQRLKRARDRELKRLFVLKNLYFEVRSDLSRYENGTVMIDLSKTRQMTPKERASAHSIVIEHLKALARFDPQDPAREIASLRQNLKEIEEKLAH